MIFVDVLEQAKFDQHLIGSFTCQGSIGDFYDDKYLAWHNLSYRMWVWTNHAGDVIITYDHSNGHLEVGGYIEQVGGASIIHGGTEQENHTMKMLLEQLYVRLNQETPKEEKSLNKQFVYLGVSFIGAAIAVFGNIKLQKEVKKTAYVKVPL